MDEERSHPLELATKAMARTAVKNADLVGSLDWIGSATFRTEWRVNTNRAAQLNVAVQTLGWLDGWMVAYSTS